MKTWIKKYWWVITLIIIVLLLINFLGPFNVVIVENAGTVIKVDENCSTKPHYYKQNGERKKIELSPKDCKTGVVVEWCRHPRKNKGCSTDKFVFKRDGWGSLMDGFFLGWWPYSTYKNWEGYKEKIGHDFFNDNRIFEPGDGVTVGYLELKWFGIPALFKNIKVVKYSR